MSTRERPVIFSGPMVRAILENRKTQTRRVVKPQPDLSMLKEPHLGLEFEFRRMPPLGPTHTPAEWGVVFKHDKPGCVPIYEYQCPYGKRGDRLYVRERFRSSSHEDGQECPCYYADNMCQCGRPSLVDVDAPGVRWKPSIHMPRWASRITLEVVKVRAERLQQIDEIDAQREGVFVDALMDLKQLQYPHRVHFKALWDDINGKKYPWESDPWVWVVEFQKI